MLNIRKIVSYAEDIYSEGGQSADQVRVAGVAAVIENPWKGQGFVQDLKPVIIECAKPLSERIVPKLIELLGSGDAIAAYGKAAVVGSSGEIEHASALIHTLRFGNVFREAAGGKSYLSFTNTRGGPNAALLMPLVHKNDSGTRSHFWTVQFAINDAPGPDEIVVAIGAASGARPNARIGDRYEDLKELEAEKSL
jgi:hypothetical protein